jgi:hypothetical protein
MVRQGAKWLDIKTFVDDLLSEQTLKILTSLRRIRDLSGVPILVMIPEFNLVDWRGDSEEPPYLNDADLPRWTEARDIALKAIANGNVPQTTRNAKSMNDLDGGTSSLSFRILAGTRDPSDPGALRALLEGAKDAAMWSGRREPPRCYSPIQAALRRGGVDLEIPTVDLPMHFENYLDGSMPDRRIFGDYCHFTLEGMRVAMALAGEALLPLLGQPCTGWKTLLATKIQIADSVIAQGSFVAAVHNANWGNCEEIVKYHLQQALERDPSIVKVMRLFMDFQTRSVPPGLCSAFEEMARKESAFLAPFFFRSTRQEKDVNFRLIKTMIETLEPFCPGISRDIYCLMGGGTFDLPEQPKPSPLCVYWSLYRSKPRSGEVRLLPGLQPSLHIHFH